MAILEDEMNFNKAQSGCIQDALSVLKGFTQDDIKNFINDTFKIAKDQNLSMDDAVKYQTDQLGKIFNNRKNLLAKQYDKAWNPKTGFVKRINSGEIRDTDLMSKNTLKNKGKDAESVISSLNANYRRQLIKSLSKNAQDILFSGSRDQDVYKYLDTGMYDRNIPEISQIGEAIKNLIETMNADKVDSGNLPLENFNKNYKLGLNYDPIKVGNLKTFPRKVMNAYYTLRGKVIPRYSIEWARENFIEAMKEECDLDQTFGMNSDEPKKIERSFGNMFDSIIRGMTTNKMYPKEVKVSPDLIKKRTMFYVPKNWQSYGKIAKEFGRGNGSLWEQLDHEMTSNAQGVGMSRVFGPDPYWGFNKANEASNKLRASDSTTKRIANKWLDNPIHMFDNLTGAVDAAADPQFAQAMSNLRAWIGMMKLPFLTATSMNDTNFGLQTLGTITKTNDAQNFIAKLDAIRKVYGSQLSKKEMPPEIKRVLENLHLSSHYEMGAISRHIDNSNMGNITRKVTNTFYKLIGMEGKDIGNMAGAVHLGMKAFGDYADVSFKDLPDNIANYLKSYKITEPEWDMLRSNMDEDLGYKVLAPDILDKVSDEDFKNLAQKIGQANFEASDPSVKDSLSPSELDRYKTTLTPSVQDTKTDLYAKTYSMLQTWANETVLSPGVAERAMMNLGTKAGTLEGEAVRSFFQFKGFLLSYVNRILVNGFKNDSSKFKYRWALTNFLYTLPLTWAGNVLYNAANGYDLNANPENWSMTDLLNNITPGMNMFYKTLAPQQGNEDSILSLLQSPTTDALSKLFSLTGAALELPDINAKDQFGKPEDFDKRAENLKSSFGKAVRSWTPINSVPGLNNWWKNNVISTKESS